MTGPILTTERLILTPVTASDFEDLKALWRDAAFVRHITGSPLPAEDVWFRLLRDLGHWQALGHGNWTMRLKADGAYVGCVGVLDYRRELVPPFDAPELGWGMSGAFHGQGYAREGLEAALGWADGVLCAPRTVCMIDHDNTPSLRLAERVGYRPYAEGAYRNGVVQLLGRLRP